MKRIALALILMIAAAYGLQAQWAQGKGKGYFKLGAWHLNTDQHFTSSGEISPNVTRTQTLVSLYAEYGLGKRLDVVAYVPFFAQATRNSITSGTTGAEISPGEDLNSIGDIDLGLNLNLHKSDHWAVSTRLLFGIPSGEDQGGSDGSFQTGDGEFNQYLSALVGYSFNLPNRIFYAKAYLGVNNRTQNFSDEMRFGIESGLGFFTSQWGVSAGVDGAFSGRIIAANPSVNAGIFYKLK